MSNVSVSDKIYTYTMATIALSQKNTELQRELKRTTDLFKAAQRELARLTKPDDVRAALHQAKETVSQLEQKLKARNGEIKELRDQMHAELNAKDELLNAKEEEIRRLSARLAEYDASTDPYLLKEA